MLKFGLILVLCIVASAQVPGFGKCPHKKPIKNIDFNRMRGTWYEVGSYGGKTILESSCSKEEYKLYDDGTVDITQFKELPGGSVTTPGIAKLSSDNGEGKFSVVFFTEPNKTELTLLVLDTDYKNYYLSYACKQVDHRSIVIASSIFTRKPVPEKEVLDHAFKVADLNGLNSKLMVRNNETAHC